MEYKNHLIERRAPVDIEKKSGKRRRGVLEILSKETG